MRHFVPLGRRIEREDRKVKWSSTREDRLKELFFFFFFFGYSLPTRGILTPIALWIPIVTTPERMKAWNKRNQNRNRWVLESRIRRNNDVTNDRREFVLVRWTLETFPPQRFLFFFFPPRHCNFKCDSCHTQ